MDGDNKTVASKKKSILDSKSDKVGEEMDSSSNPYEEEWKEIKEATIEEKNKMGAKNEEAEKLEIDFPPSNQDGEELEELKEALSEHENELGAKTEKTGKQETISLPSNPDEEELEELKEATTGRKTKWEPKMRKQVKQRLDFHN